ncbi:hypothetical protein ACCO45_012907 [Purpureocillium lilacinum]|uniref:Uncharacterized protein n=1 Tax=Purpureocillium lilacinum TaxID=33203 RepID=A0ACC4DBI1_PURLI
MRAMALACVRVGRLAASGDDALPATPSRDGRPWGADNLNLRTKYFVCRPGEEEAQQFSVVAANLHGPGAPNAGPWSPQYSAASLGLPTDMAPRKTPCRRESKDPASTTDQGPATRVEWARNSFQVSYSDCANHNAVFACPL